MKGNNAARSRNRGVRATRSAGSGRRPSTTRHDVALEVGATIQFDPTGERLRIARIDDGQITFEKLP